MFYLATHIKRGCFVFYYEDGGMPISSNYGSFEFPTHAPSKSYEELRTFSGILKRMLKDKITIIDSDPQFYQLVARHPEFSL